MKSKLVIYAAIAGCFLSCNKKIYLNRESTDSHGNPMLLGVCTREKLQQKPYGDWFNKNYTDYRIDTAVAEKLRTALSGKSFRIFMGTWCGDSKREVPRICKLFDYCGVSQAQVQFIMVDNHDSVYKQSPGHEERGLNIHRVPDLLVFEHGRELGRIVESPVLQIEPANEHARKMLEQL